MIALSRFAAGTVLMLALFASNPTGIAPSSAQTTQAGYLNQLHVANWNIWGGKGLAYSRYNSIVADFRKPNTVQSRIKARFPYLYGLGLQEVCESQYNSIRFELVLDGYWLNGAIGGGGGYTDKFVMALSPFWLGSPDLHDDCGDWFGTAVYIRGASNGAGDRFANQDPLRAGKSGWVCLWSLAVVCSAHLAVSNYHNAQATELKNVGNFLIGVTGFRTFISADFNVQPGLVSLDWSADGWRDADQPIGGITQATTHSGLISDYIWSKKPNNWYPDAWVPHSSSLLSDHYWKQGYF